MCIYKYINNVNIYVGVYLVKQISVLHFDFSKISIILVLVVSKVVQMLIRFLETALKRIAKRWKNTIFINLIIT